MKTAKIAIIGAGKWGLALFGALSQKNECIITSRTPRNIAGFVDLKTALKSPYLLVVLSTQITDTWLSANFNTAPRPKDQKILVASKGIDAQSGNFLHQIYEKYISAQNLAYLSGPSFADEVNRALPCALVVSSKNSDIAKEFSEFFPSFMKAYTSSDVIGAEICGAYKNVIAIAGGICDGLGLGNNARASLISRGLIEMDRFGSFFGAANETFLGLSGAGDLFLSASSNLSRNYRVGFALANGRKIDEILRDLGEVAEGVATAKAIVKIANEWQIYTPIAREVALIIDGKSPKTSVQDLLKHAKS